MLPSFFFVRPDAGLNEGGESKERMESGSRTGEREEGHVSGVWWWRADETGSPRPRTGRGEVQNGAELEGRTPNSWTAIREFPLFFPSEVGGLLWLCLSAFFRPGVWGFPEPGLAVLLPRSREKLVTAASTRNKY